MAKQFAWSYSALTMYENCPKQYWHVRVAKDVRDEKSEAQVEGTRVHKAFEDRIKRKQPLSPDLSKFEPVAAIYDMPVWKQVDVELKWALDKHLRPCGWFDHDVWVRAMADVSALRTGTSTEPVPVDNINIIDWKTGKRRPDDTQLKLLAAIAFQWYPSAGTADASFIWLREKAVDKVRIEREPARKIWSDLYPRVQAMEQAIVSATMPARPTKLCGWCPVKTCAHHP